MIPSGRPHATTAGVVTKVLVVIEENHSLSQMKTGMPYLYSAAEKYGYATHYTAITHPSLPNYLAIAGGSTFGLADDLPPSVHPISGQSVFGQAIARGRTAKLYAESMVDNCELANDGRYAVKHNPWAYFVDERASCHSYDVPLRPALADDSAAGKLPNVGMIVPSLDHDAHDGSLRAADAWLRTHLGDVFAGPDWKSGHLAIVITADEDDRRASNNVLTVVIHPSQLHHVVNTPRLGHYSLTRLFAQVVGTPPLRHGVNAVNLRAAFGLTVR